MTSLPFPLANHYRGSAGLDFLFLISWNSIADANMKSLRIFLGHHTCPQTHTIARGLAYLRHWVPLTENLPLHFLLITRLTRP